MIAAQAPTLNSIRAVSGTSSANMASVSQVEVMEPVAKLPCFMVGSQTENQETFDRSDVVELIDKVLLPGPGESRSNDHLRSFVIHGFAGVGKTEVALQYAFTRRPNYDAVFFVSSDTEDQLREGFCRIARELGLSTPEEAAKNPTESLSRVKAWLRRPLKAVGYTENQSAPTQHHVDGSMSQQVEDLAAWLIIFDNADNPKHVLNYWPQNGIGSVLITSQVPEARSNSFFGNDGLKLDPLPLPKAVEFLQQLIRHGYGLKEDDDLTLSEQVARRLEGLPFSIVQAVGIMKHQRISLTEFEKTYMNNANISAFFKTKVDDALQHRYKHTNIASAWALKDLGEGPKSLLNFIALLRPDLILEDMLTNELESSSDEHFSFLEGNYREKLGELIQVSQIERDYQKKQLRLHPIVRDATIARIKGNPAEFRLAFDRSVRLIALCWPFALGTGVGKGHEKHRFGRCLHLFTHIKKLSEVFRDHVDIVGKSSNTLQFAKLLSEAAW